MQTHTNLKKMIRDFWFIFLIKYKNSIQILMFMSKNSVPFEGLSYSRTCVQTIQADFIHFTLDIWLKSHTLKTNKCVLCKNLMTSNMKSFVKKRKISFEAEQPVLYTQDDQKVRGE